MRVVRTLRHEPRSARHGGGADAVDAGATSLRPATRVVLYGAVVTSISNHATQDGLVVVSIRR